MKKGISIMFLLLLFVATQAQARLNILACEPEWAALAQELTGDLAKISSATTAQQDPHYIQARPSLQAKARRADLLVCTGSELELGWLPILLRTSGNPKIQMGRPGYFMASEHVHLLGKPAVLDRTEGDIHAEGNPHIQTDPRNMLPVAKALTSVLIRVDPDNAASYQERLQQFTSEWEKAIRGWEEQARPLKGKRVIVHHQRWIYLEHWLGLAEVGTLEVKPGIPPTSGHLSRLMKETKAEPAALIIYANYQDPKAAKWLSERTGIPSLELPSTVGADKEVDDLFALYDVTIRRLLGAMD